MDLRRLSYFIAVVEQGSLGKAADRLSVSQPALTKSLNLLEAELGVKLLDRMASGVVPTVYGRSLFVRAKAILADVQHAQAEIEQLRGEQPGQARIGALPSVTAGLVARAVANLTSRQLGLAIQVTEKQNYELLPALRRGEFDFVIALDEGWQPEVGIRQRLLMNDRLSLVVRGGHPLAGLARVTHADMLRYPWMFPISGTTHRPVLRQLFAEVGMAAPEPRVGSGSMQFSKSVIRESDVIGIMPSHAMQRELEEGRLYRLPIESVALERTIAVYYRDRYPLAAPVRAVLREIETTCRRWIATPPPRAAGPRSDWVRDPGPVDRASGGE